ncbi:MAG: methyltransferase domain-containing protein [Acidobacteria bacterium]|nr:methyltransferase domain-containing protein [Acidobacteriota bacterium]
MQLPFHLRAAIEEELASVKPDALAQAAAELSIHYRANEAPRNRAIATATHAQAYLATRLPATFAAAHSVLSELHQRMPEAGFASLLDLGAGQGAAMWAAAEVFDELAKITLIERDRNLIQMGKQLAEKSAVAAMQTADWQHGNVESAFAVEPHDVVVMAYALGELKPPAQLSVIKRAWQITAKTLVIIEPGTTQGYANVMQARTELIQQGAQVVAPCPHALPCPMQGRDWCHFSARVERAAFHRRAKAATSAYEDEKFSYFIGTKLDAVNATEARIVRHPKIFKGHINLELCARDGLERTTITKSNKEAFRRARKSAWGDAWQTDEE